MVMKMFSWIKKACFIFGFLFLAACSTKEVTLFQNIDETSANVLMNFLPSSQASLINENGSYTIRFKLF